MLVLFVQFLVAVEIIHLRLVQVLTSNFEYNQINIKHNLAKLNIRRAERVETLCDTKVGYNKDNIWINTILLLIGLSFSLLIPFYGLETIWLTDYWILLGTLITVLYLVIPMIMRLFGKQIGEQSRFIWDVLVMVVLFIPRSVLSFTDYSTTFFGRYLKDYVYFELLFANDNLVAIFDEFGIQSPLNGNLSKLNFVVSLIALILLYILVQFFKRRQKYSLKEWRMDNWKDPDSRSQRGRAILLVHGFKSSMKAWKPNRISNYSIMQYIKEKNQNPRIFAISFTDQLKNRLTDKYEISNQEWSATKVSLDEDLVMNAYEFELLYTIQLLEKMYNINELTVITHSSGGVVLRKVIPMLKSKIIKKVVWLSAPHRGAQGSVHFVHFIGNSILKYFFAIPFWLLSKIPGFNKLMQRFFMKFFRTIHDGQAVEDLFPDSPYIRSLNQCELDIVNVDVTPGDISFINISGKSDFIAGSGSILLDHDMPDHSLSSYLLEVTHTDVKLKFLTKVKSIHHSREVCDIIFNY